MLMLLTAVGISHHAVQVTNRLDKDARRLSKTHSVIALGVVALTLVQPRIINVDHYAKSKITRITTSV